MMMSLSKNKLNSMQAPQVNCDVYEDFCLSKVSSGKLRIWLIDNILQRKDMTKQQRRTLMTSRNTARFRERERKREIKERLFAVDIPETEKMVRLQLKLP